MLALGALLPAGPGCTQLLPVLVVDAGPTALDAPSRDAPSDDAPPSDDAAPSDDAPLVLDASSDTGRDVPPDAPRTDAPAPLDAGRDGGPDGGPAPSCNAAYGSLPGYLLCSETASGCTFGVSFGGGLSDCRSVCMSAGGACLEAYRMDAGGGACTLTNRQACGSGASPATCVCTR